MEDEYDYKSPGPLLVKTLACVDPGEVAGLRAEIERLTREVECSKSNADRNYAKWVEVTRERDALRNHVIAALHALLRQMAGVNEQSGGDNG